MNVGAKIGSGIHPIGEEQFTRDSPAQIFRVTKLLQLLRVHRRLIAGLAFLLLAITTIITFALTPLYSAEAIVILDQRKNNVTDVDAIFSGLTGDVATVQAQLQILQSRSLLTHVIDKAHLENDPEFHRGPQGDSVFKSMTVLIPASWFDIPVSWFKKSVTIKTPAEQAQDLKDEVIDNLLKRLTVSTVGLSQAIKIEFRSENAQGAARITNAIADAYIEDQLNAKFEATEKASKWLSDRLSELSSQVQTAESAVAQYKADNNLTETTLGVSSVDQQLGEINSQLVIAKSNLAEQAAKFGRVRELQQAGRSADVTQVVDSPLINQLRAQETVLLRQEAELSSKYGPRHPKMVDLQSQKVNLQQKIAEEVGRVTQTASNEVAVAQAKANSLAQSLNDIETRATKQNRSRVMLKQLEANAASTRSLYDAFLSRFKQTEDRQGIQTPDARILSAAAVPGAPSYPNKTLIFGAAIPASLFLGFIAAIFAELLDNGFRTSAQVEQTLALPVLSTVPEMKGKKATVLNIVTENPLSSFAESMRGIQLGLTLADVDRPPKVILVTSAMPQEGKSTIALSLARLGARNGKKVVLIDCDLRRPNVLAMVRAGELSKGLIKALLGTEKVENCFYKDPQSDVLLLAPETTAKNPGDLLSSVAMENLIRDLRSLADWIIIDSAPLLPVNDTRLLIRSVDSVLFMVRWEKTPRDAALAAVRSLVDVRAPIAGVVMTRADSTRYNYYNYGFQNYSNYTRYYHK